MQTTKMFPIVFQFRDLIAGNGFIALVLMDGRALLTVDDDNDHWVHGVQPGAVSGGASDASTALNEFKARYQSVLFDIAEDARTFSEFEREVRSFFLGINAQDEMEWASALEEVHRTNLSVNELPTVIVSL